MRAMFLMGGAMIWPEDEAEAHALRAFAMPCGNDMRYQGKVGDQTLGSLGSYAPRPVVASMRGDEVWELATVAHGVPVQGPGGVPV